MSSGRRRDRDRAGIGNKKGNRTDVREHAARLPHIVLQDVDVTLPFDLPTTTTPRVSRSNMSSR